MKNFTITEEEHKKLLKLYDEATSTPVMIVGGVDISAHAWKSVKDYMEELGKKYGYNPQTAKIKRDSLTFEAEEVKK